MISSLGSRRTFPFYAMAGIAKAALESLTRYLAVELAPKGIIVNGVVPGAVVAKEGPQPWDLYPDKEATLQVLRGKTPIRKLTTPEDVAHVVSFLAGPAAGAIVGQTITVDGGYSLVY